MSSLEKISNQFNQNSREDKHWNEARNKHNNEHLSAEVIITIAEPIPAKGNKCKGEGWDEQGQPVIHFIKRKSKT